MKKYKSPWFLNFLVIFLLLTFFLVLSLFLVKNRLDFSQNSQQIFINLLFKTPMLQTFTAQHNFINIITLQMKNPGMTNKGQFKLTVKKDNLTLVEQLFSGQNLGDPADVKFQFNPIPSSKSKNFSIIIESLSADEPLAVAVGAAKKDVLDKENTFFGQERLEGDLKFSVYYRVFDKKEVLNQLFNNFSRNLFDDKIFFIFWIVVVVILGATGVKEVLKD